MSHTAHRFAYRCLPLNIANAHGWQILNSEAFTATWNGEPDIDAVSVRPCDSGQELLARSHFGSGVLTFSVNAVFRTEPGYDLMVTGPLNEPKDGIQPLSAVVETDWSPATFTMNWKITRKHKPISFERDEAYCMIFPVKRGLIEELEPEIRPMSEEPSLSRSYGAFAQSRKEFNERLRMLDPPIQNQAWQKDYFKGHVATEKAPADHRTKLNLKEFRTIE